MLDTNTLLRNSVLAQALKVYGTGLSERASLAQLDRKCATQAKVASALLSQRTGPPGHSHAKEPL